MFNLFILFLFLLLFVCLSTNLLNGELHGENTFPASKVLPTHFPTFALIFDPTAKKEIQLPFRPSLHFERVLVMKLFYSTSPTNTLTSWNVESVVSCQTHCSR